MHLWDMNARKNDALMWTTSEGKVRSDTEAEQGKEMKGE
jgi:hypothetical protein